MRVTFSTGQAATMADLENAASQLAKCQREVSSGKKLLTPSDDPGGWSTSVRERSELSVADQYVRTADSATSRLTVVDTVLSDLINQLTSARSSVVAGQGTTQTASQREATAKGLEGLRDAVFDDLNTTFNGTYFFSGSSALTAPYVRNSDGSISAYKGDTQTISVDVDRSRSVAVSFVGSDISVDSSGQDLFATFKKVIDGVRSGDQTAMADGLKELEAAFDRVVRVQSGVGASMTALDGQRTRLSETKLATKTRLSKLEDANMADSITEMSQADTAYKSALSAIGTRTKLSLLDYLS